MKQSKRRTVTNDEFNKALANMNNVKIMQEALSKYRGIIPYEDLQRCGLDALWRCIGYHEDNKGNKFTTSLWRFIVWECRRELKRIRQQGRIHTVSLSQKEDFDISTNVNNQIKHLHEYITLLDSDSRDIINQYYFERRTMQEIGDIRGCSKQTIGQKIHKALIELRKMCNN